MRIIQYLAFFFAALLVITFHEFAHAFAAVKCGDLTPKMKGRYTLNPFAHVNIIGLIMMIFVHFGWAEPVPINPYNFKNLKKGYFWTSIAGVLTNLVMAFIVLPLYMLFIKYRFDFMLFDDFIGYFLSAVVTLNLSFFVFNLIPVYPLDGFRVLEVAVKSRGPVMRFLRDKGYIVLLVLLVFSFISDYTGLWYLDVFGNVLTFIVERIYVLFRLFWGLFIAL